MVPMLTCGLVRSNFAFATVVLLWTSDIYVELPEVTGLRIERSSGRAAYAVLLAGERRPVSRPPPPRFRWWPTRLRRREGRFSVSPPRPCQQPFRGSSPGSERRRRKPCLLAGGLGDDLLGHVRRHLGVRVELHAVARPALGLRPQVADVAEHLAEGDQGLDGTGVSTLAHL